MEVEGVGLVSGNWQFYNPNMDIVTDLVNDNPFVFIRLV